MSTEYISQGPLTIAESIRRTGWAIVGELGVGGKVLSNGDNRMVCWDRADGLLDVEVFGDNTIRDIKAVLGLERYDGDSE